RQPFTQSDFQQFIAERHQTILEAVEDLLIKQRLDLSPQLRELDQRIEVVELNVRSEIERVLAADPGALPQHINQKIEERVQAALRKSPALSQDSFQVLSRRLEYCDLRDLQDIVLSKALWPEFSLRFVNKEGLAAKFNQLAELRNAIRHSRSV